jgi:hypothetical protein
MVGVDGSEKLHIAAFWDFVVGRLGRAMDFGAETTFWAINVVVSSVDPGDIVKPETDRIVWMLDCGGRPCKVSWPLWTRDNEMKSNKRGSWSTIEM